MFVLSKNTFITNGVCHYEDEYGNKATIRRTGDVSFAAKLRFTDGKIKATPMSIDVEKVLSSGIVGDTLHLDYPPDAEVDSEKNRAAIHSFTKLIQYWIALFSDLRFSWCNNDILLKQVTKEKEHGIFGTEHAATETDLYKYKYGLLKKYKELEPVLHLVTEP